MKKAIVVAASALAFFTASVVGIDRADAFTPWGPTTPTQIANYLDTSTTIVGDFAQVRAGVFGGAVTAFINANQGPYTNTAQIVCNTGTNAQTLNGTSTTDGNITLVCPWFGSTQSGDGSIQSN